MSAFFLDDGSCGNLYASVRDSPDLAGAKAFIETLWTIYEPLADTNFRERAACEFHQRFWEMYVGCTFLSRGYDPKKVGDDGPEFYFERNGKRFWVEAIAPTAGSPNSPDRVPSRILNEISESPIEKILLRYTNALLEKRDRYLDACKNGHVEPSDGYLLAINSANVPFASVGSHLPFALQAYLGVGHLSVNVDKLSGQVADSFLTARVEIQKSNGSPVSTTSLLEPSFAMISGVIESTIHCASHVTALGEDFVLIKNPLARHSVSSDDYSWCKRYELVGSELIVGERT